MAAHNVKTVEGLASRFDRISKTFTILGRNLFDFGARKRSQFNDRYFSYFEGDFNFGAKV